MRPLTTRHLVLAVCATAVVSVVTATGADAGGRHAKKHHHRMDIGFNDVRGARASATTYNRGGPVCPGLARSFDCAVWPPPFDEDPDRKQSGSDGG